jgi:hypothetical protein
MTGTRYDGNTCIQPDHFIAEYVEWLISLQHPPIGKGTI